MGPFEWIVTGLSILLSLGGGLCAVILPILILGGIGYYLYRRNQQSTAYWQAAQSWPSTTGLVLGSTIKVTRSARSRSETPVVVYEYEVNGRSYKEHSIKAGDQFMRIQVFGEAMATISRYPVGKKVTVYYDPANPARSALER
jgi:hypothetical protein